MIKENQKTKGIVNKEQKLIALIKDLGEMARVCTYSYIKEVCHNCECQKKQKGKNDKIMAKN